MKSVLILLLFLALSTITAIAAESGIEPQKIKGKYVGNIEVILQRPPQIKNYEFVVNIFKIVPEKNVLSLKTICNKCEPKEATMSGCTITAVTPDLLFGCKGETWHVDYQLHGDELKGNGVSPKGSPYTVKAKKVQETEK